MSSKKSSSEAETGAAGAKAAAETAGKAVEETVGESAAGESAEATSDALASARAEVRKVQAAAAHGYGQLVDLQKDNFEAAIKFGTIMARGYEAIGKEVMAFAQTALEANFAALQEVLSAATLRDAVDLHRDHLRKTFDQAVAEGGKLGDMSLKLASEATAPLLARVNAAVERFVKPMAA